MKSHFSTQKVKQLERENTVQGRIRVIWYRNLASRPPFVHENRGIFWPENRIFQKTLRFPVLGAKPELRFPFSELFTENFIFEKSSQNQGFSNGNFQCRKWHFSLKSRNWGFQKVSRLSSSVFRLFLGVAAIHLRIREFSINFDQKPISGAFPSARVKFTQENRHFPRKHTVICTFH